MQLGTFLAGVVTGAGLMYGAITHHLLRTDEGFQLIPKLQPAVGEMYLDVRQYTISDWSRHPSVAAAVVKAGKQNLFAQQAESTIRQQVDEFIHHWGSAPAGS